MLDTWQTDSWIMIVAWVLFLESVLHLRVIRSKLSDTELKIFTKSTKLMMVVLSIIVLWGYLVFVLHRPDLGPRGMTQIGAWYLPVNNVIAVLIAGIVLLVLTRNVFLSLFAGASSTQIWQTVMARPNLYLEGKEPFIIHPFEYSCLKAVLLLTLLVGYWAKPIHNYKHMNKALIVSFLVFAVTFLLFSFFPQIVAPNWVRIHLGGKFSPSSIPELIFDIILRGSGYLFWALAQIKVIECFSKGKDCVLR